MYNDIINHSKFKQFLKKVNGKISSSPTQIKRTNIIIDTDYGKFGLFSNGYIIKYSTDGWSVLRKPSDNLKLSIEDYLEMLDVINKLIDRNIRLEKERLAKLPTLAKKIIPDIFNEKLSLYAYRLLKEKKYGKFYITYKYALENNET